MGNRRSTVFFLLIDWLCAIGAWVLFYYLRKVLVEGVPFNVGDSFFYGIIFIPVLWLILYYLQGTYQNVKRLYRFKLLGLTFSSSLIGSVLIFFTFLLDDEISGYQMYYKSVFLLFVSHFLVTLIPRLVFITLLVRRIHLGKDGFTTLLIGGSDKAVEIYKEINQLPKNIYRFIGFININGVDRQLENDLPYLGHIDDLERIFQENNVGGDVTT